MEPTVFWVMAPCGGALIAVALGMRGQASRQWEVSLVLERIRPSDRICAVGWRQPDSEMVSR